MRAFLILSLTALSACGSLGGVTTTVRPVSQTPAPTQPTTPVENGLGCPQTERFAGEGRVMRVDQPESDTAIVGLISWRSAEGCEVFQIDFQTAEGAPATTPPSVVVEFLRSRQIVRIHVNALKTVITDQLVETDLVDRLYVVRSIDGEIFIDLHLRLPVQVRSRVTNSPARLILELQKGETGFEGAAAISDQTILVNPWSGDQTATNIEVSGYARTANGEVLVIATAGNQVVAEKTIETADSSQTWGEFKTRIDILPGETSLFAGDRDPADGGLVGITINILSR